MSFHRDQFDDCGSLFDLVSRIITFTLFISNAITFIKTMFIGNIAGKIVIGIIMCSTFIVYILSLRRQTITREVLIAIELSHPPSSDLWWRRYSHPLSDHSGYPDKRPAEGKYGINCVDPMPVLMPYDVDYRWSIGIKGEPEHREPAPYHQSIQADRIPTDPVPFENANKEIPALEHPYQMADHDTYSIKYPLVYTETLRN